MVIEKKWDIIYTQILLAATEGATENIGEGLHLRNVKHYTPWKSMYSKYWLIKVLENCFINMDCFSWIRLIPFLIHLKYWYYNSLCLKLPCLSHYFCQILSYPSESLFNTVLIMFSSVSLFFPTSLDYKVPQVLNIPNHIPSRDNQIYYQAIYRLEYLIGQARWLVNQKAESLGFAFLSKLYNMVNTTLSSIQCFLNSLQVFPHFHNPTCAFNQRYNPHQKALPLLQSIFTYLSHLYLFTKSSLQSPIKSIFLNLRNFSPPSFCV